jgi:ribosomal protein L3 glutamine methyltransferase
MILYNRGLDKIMNNLNELHTLRDFVRWGASRFNEANLFFGHGTDNAIDESVALILHALHLNQNLPESLWACHLTIDEKQQISQLFQRRINERIPAPYLTNEAWFAGLSFYVDQNVLIPRSPIAELIEQQFDPWLETDQIQTILEIGTGSGCIAIATALVLTNAHVDAVDISAQALEIAQKNIETYDLISRVTLLEGDVFEPVQNKKYDLIICNPPYVDAFEMENLPPEFQHEPRLALEAGNDGLDIVRKILQQARNHLNNKGLLIVEVGASQPTLLETYPDVDFIFPDFKRGGDGVFLLTKEQLETYSF